MESLKADPDAFYAKELMLDLSTVQPHVSGPNTVKVMTGLGELQKKEIKIDKKDFPGLFSIETHIRTSGLTRPTSFPV